MKHCARAVAMVFFLVLQCSVLCAKELPYSSGAIFTNAFPANSYHFGLGTSQFSWGEPIVWPWGDSSSFTFVPKSNIYLNTNGPFSLGYITYTNKETWAGTEAKTVDIEVSIVSATGIFKFKSKIGIQTTLNDDPDTSGDTILLPINFTKEVSTGNNPNIDVKILGFGSLDGGNSVNILNSLKIDENQSYDIQLIAEVTTVVPVESVDIFALGDSVPAGYGLAMNGGYEGSYPQKIQKLWAAKKGYSLKNLASSGAISGDCEEHCNIMCEDSLTPQCKKDCIDGSVEPYIAPCHSVIEDQMNPIFNTKSKIVTLTVGADDIGFADCLISWFSKDMTNNPNDNNCAPGNKKFIKNLALLKKNLTGIFSLLDMTKDQVFVTLYYDPFPKAEKSVCKPFYYPLAAMGLMFHKELAVLYQNQTSTFVNTALNLLNQTIKDAAASYSHVHVVPLNFKGHDFCKKGQNAWAYGTKVVITSEIPFGKTVTKALPSECPYPPIEESKAIVSGGNYSFFRNCIPHPTDSGHTAIAKWIIKDIKSLKLF